MESHAGDMHRPSRAGLLNLAEGDGERVVRFVLDDLAEAGTFYELHSGVARPVEFVLDESGELGTPSEASVLVESGAPGEANVPGESGMPDVPGEPGESGVPGEASVPGESGMLDVPGEPGVPTVSGESGALGDVSVSGVPGALDEVCMPGKASACDAYVLGFYLDDVDECDVGECGAVEQKVADALRGLPQGAMVYGLCCSASFSASSATCGLERVAAACAESGRAWCGGMAVRCAAVLPRLQGKPRMGMARRKVSEAADELLLAIRCGSYAGTVMSRPILPCCLREALRLT